MRRSRKHKSETSLQIQIADSQAVTQKRLNGGRRARPDMFVSEPAPRRINGSWKHEWHGLYLEVKKDGARLKKKNDEWATPHISEQAEMLENLREKGYKAEFAVGFEQAKQIIDQYLN